MSLILEVEYLSGVSFAAIGPDSDVPDWPPQPDRIFSALVASWAARGEREEERRALEWLEMRSVPRLLASDAEARTSAVVFVPPNDPRSDRQKNARGVLPALRSRQPRRFPAVRPHDPVIRLCWPDAEPDEAMLSALQALAHDTAYVGHSASLTRCRFLLDRGALDWATAERPRRGVYRGRLEELRRAHARFEESADKKDRPQKGVRISPEPRISAKRSNMFGDGWLILEHVAGDMLDIRACALVAKTLRDTLLSGYRQMGLEDKIPEIVSGHAADGSPACVPHLAIVPLAFAGFPYADGHVMGFALVPPTNTKILARPGQEDTAETKTFRDALRKLTKIDGSGRRILEVKSAEGTPRDRAFSIGLSLTFEPPADKRSLDPALYTRPAQMFATVTPIVLDRHLKEKGAARQDEAVDQIKAACLNIGLPEPPHVVAVDKHSAIEGAPSAYPSGKSPRWMNWRVPSSLASRQLTHAVIRFAEPVDGPVILCAGRFVGLGLCRPIDGEGADADR